MSAPQEGYETRDVSLMPVVISAAVLFVLGIAISVGLYFLLFRFERQEAARDEPPSPYAATADRPAPEPQLQGPTPHALRAEQEANLRGYAWIDRGAGRIRVPIERAMELVAEREKPAESKKEAR
jgi:hypothetical protein